MSDHLISIYGKQRAFQCSRCKIKDIEIEKLKNEIAKEVAKVKRENLFKVKSYKREIKNLKFLNSRQEKKINKLSREDTELKYKFLQLKKKLNRLLEKNKSFYINNSPNSTLKQTNRLGSEEDDFIRKYNTTMNLIPCESGFLKRVKYTERIYVEVDQERNQSIEKLKHMLLNNTFLKDFEKTNKLQEAKYFFYFIHMNNSRKMFILQSDLFSRKCQMFRNRERKFFNLTYNNNNNNNMGLHSSHNNNNIRRIIVFVAKNEENVENFIGNPSEILIMNKKEILTFQDRVFFFSVPNGDFDLSKNQHVINELKKVMVGKKENKNENKKSKSRCIGDARSRIQKIELLDKKKQHLSKRKKKKKKNIKNDKKSIIGENEGGGGYQHKQTQMSVKVSIRTRVEPLLVSLEDI